MYHKPVYTRAIRQRWRGYRAFPESTVSAADWAAWTYPGTILLQTPRGCRGPTSFELRAWGRYVPWHGTYLHQRCAELGFAPAYRAHSASLHARRMNLHGGQTSPGPPHVFKTQLQAKTLLPHTNPPYPNGIPKRSKRQFSTIFMTGEPGGKGVGWRAKLGPWTCRDSLDPPTKTDSTTLLRAEVMMTSTTRPT